MESVEKHDDCRPSCEYWKFLTMNEARKYLSECRQLSVHGHNIDSHNSSLVLELGIRDKW